jgi:hypothetical protein
MYMSSPVLVNGRVIGLSHRKKGQYFALEPATGAVHWKSDPGQGENAAFVLAGGALIVLQGDGTLLVLPQDGAAFSPTHRYRVAESATPRTSRSHRAGHPGQGRERPGPVRPRVTIGRSGRPPPTVRLRPFRKTSVYGGRGRRTFRHCPDGGGSR